MEKSKIQWTEATWNPWHGCKKVSPGCKFCYMYRDKERYGQEPTSVLKSKTNFKAPLKWKEGKLIFTCSWSDWFIDVADEWRDEAWNVIRNTPHHTYQILTKRPERILENLPEDFAEFNNVWIGVSVESQDQVGRLGYLLDLPCITFASFEPLISPIAWDENADKLDWMIIGGESGNNTGKYRFRPMEQKWAEDLVNASIVAGVPCFVKQLGTYLSKKLNLIDRHGGEIMEFPLSLQVRDFPKKYKNQLQKKIK